MEHNSFTLPYHLHAWPRFWHIAWNGMKSFKRRPYWSRSLMKRIIIDELNFTKMLNRTDQHSRFLHSILFFRWITLKDQINRHKCRYWSDANPHSMLDIYTQYVQKVTVCGGILKEALFGPLYKKLQRLLVFICDNSWLQHPLITLEMFDVFDNTG